jgi:hypothetical protein|tara:strand:- start:3243 stop:3527 length:285 start_codon:yes stop_codon:yes gene_type:complete
MRQDLVDWVSCQHGMLELADETFHLALRFLDTFLLRRGARRGKFLHPKMLLNISSRLKDEIGVGDVPFCFFSLVLLLSRVGTLCETCLFVPEQP